VQFATNALQQLVTGPPKGLVWFCWLASVVVCNAAGGLSAACERVMGMLPAVGPAGRRARGWSVCRRPGTWAVGRLTLHGGPVVLRPIRATPYSI